MIVAFRERGTEDIFNGENTDAARRTCPKTIWRAARRKLDQLNQAVRLADLAAPPANRLALHGDRRGQHSIRINDRYRVCFRWTERGAQEVEITDYH
ncbi:MAG TPA: type II toxin-antitoxin system RelE/ParE family toxin [bacterium]|nr:type II toxin-antitoxin system RelE/ParE family toxin [bacterium]